MVPGLANPKGWQPLLGILREGLLSGSVEQKEMSSISMRQLVALSDEKGLKPHAVNMAGPLIRVLGDREAAPSVAPLPAQMQSVFLKILQEPTSSANIKTAAGSALSRIVEFHPKPESIVNELIKLQKTAENPAEIETLLENLQAKIQAKNSE
uniref:Uncharacterized protein n=1 Tax=Ditylenchus dipsaci TaxID=166011 RepID=A0A915EUD4_9BILA